MLAACRNLHRSGFEVTCLSATALACAGWSRTCDRRVKITDPRADSERFLEQLREELSRQPCAVLLPGSDSSLLAISRGRERLEDLTAIGLPRAEQVEHALDRQALCESAQQAGLTGASSIRCAALSEALTAARELGYPVVLKSVRAATFGERATHGAPKSRVARDEDELRRDAPLFDGPLLVQPRLTGELLSFGGVFADRRLLAVAVSRYQRTWPPSAGSVTFSETIDPPRGLEDGVARLLEHIGWEGIFELELIRTRPSEFVAIDLNPRPYGSMALACDAGAPLPAVWCRWVLDGDPEPARARAGRRYRWEEGDLNHAAWQARHGQLRAALRPLRPHRGVTHANFEPGDPVPLLAQGAYLARKTLIRWGQPSRRPELPRAR